MARAWRIVKIVLRVPSAIIAHEHNVVINPAHRHFAQLLLTGPVPLEIDPRVFRRTK